MAAASQPARRSGGVLSGRVAGIPTPLLILALAAVGVYVYRTRTKTAAAQQQTAANTAGLATTGTAAGDPVLTAYQTGEAAGVASYSAGVTSGISLVDSILGMFPGSTSAAAAGNNAAQTIGAGVGTAAGAGQPTAATTGQGGSSTGTTQPSGPNYVQVPNPLAGSAEAAAGQEVYLNVPGMPGTYVPGVVNGQRTAAWNQLAGQPGVSEYVLQ